MIQRIGHILIFAGAAVWLVYALFWLFGADPEVRAFLPFHLAGVIPGALLSRWDSIRRFFSRN